MRGSFRPVPLVLLLCAAAGLSGCTGEVDLAKATFERSTVPAAVGLDGGGSTTSGGVPKANEDAFKTEKLRLVNPCGLMDDDTLAAFGEPAESRLRDFAMCSNYMKNADGKELNFTLTLGESISGEQAKGDKNIGGLPASESELDDKTACFATAVTETSPNRGIQVQTGGEAGDLCDPARKLLEAVVTRIREDPPLLEQPKGTLVELDPCGSLDDATLTAAIGAGATKRPQTMHQCYWNVSGASFSLEYQIETDPKELQEAAETQAVDLGSGVTGYQKAETSSGVRCHLVWSHVDLGGESTDHQAEVVSLDFSRYEPQQGEDVCGKTQTVAKALIAKLPAK